MDNGGDLAALARRPLRLRQRPAPPGRQRERRRAAGRLDPRLRRPARGVGDGRVPSAGQRRRSADRCEAPRDRRRPGRRPRAYQGGARGRDRSAAAARGGRRPPARRHRASRLRTAGDRKRRARSADPRPGDPRAGDARRAGRIASVRLSVAALPAYGEVLGLRQTAAALVSRILATDEESMQSLADAELARRAAVASLEQGETTLAAYRRVLTPPSPHAPWPIATAEGQRGGGSSRNQWAPTVPLVTEALAPRPPSRPTGTRRRSESCGGIQSLNRGVVGGDEQRHTRQSGGGGAAHRCCSQLGAEAMAGCWPYARAAPEDGDRQTESAPDERDAIEPAVPSGALLRREHPARRRNTRPNRSPS